LFAKRPLPFAALLQRLDATPGPLLSRLQTVLAANLVPEESIRYADTGGIGFTAESRGRTVVPVIVAIEHVHEEPTRDTTPPQIVVLAPPVRETMGTVERGFEIVAKQGTLRVQGQALDASGIAEVLVNGQRAQVDTAGNFQAVVPLNGTRTLHIRATDTQGNRRDATFAILRYAP
jgi:glucodextranase-like protein